MMESDLLAITIIPESGGKIQSIYDKDRQKEVLYQSEQEEFRKSNYGAKYESGDVSGFDEVFPTIDECFYRSPKPIQIYTQVDCCSVPASTRTAW